MVRAKFKVQNKEAKNDGVNISLTPVVNGSPENEEFFKLTPGGSIQLFTVNTQAAEEFEVGAEYHVEFVKDFTPASVTE